LNSQKNHPRRTSSNHVSGSRRPPCGLSNRAARAGLRVRELKAENKVETAIVMPN
jgi:hypothetical protein